MNRLLLLLLILLLYSCSSTEHLAKTYSEKEIRQDVVVVINSLRKRHIDINWENNEEKIISELIEVSKLGELSQDSFLVLLNNVLQNVDDGHTRLMKPSPPPYIALFQKLTNHPSIPKFECYPLDNETVYYKIPRFIGTFNFWRSLLKWRAIHQKMKVKRLIVDFRGNRGGSIRKVGKFLQYFVDDDFQFYQSLKMKRKSVFLFLNPSWKKKDGFYQKKEKIIKSKLDESIQHKYLLVDSMIISGSMLATYHLKKDGFIIMGNDPRSLFNTFGAAIKPVKLPNSKALLFISQVRVFLNGNSNQRDADMLHCDLPILNQDLDKILEQILKYEEKNTHPK